MAKIEKSEVIQKVVDGLRLSVGAENIPQEVEDKIRAVFNVNPDKLIKVEVNSAIDDASNVIFTTNATKKTFLTGMYITITKSVLSPSISTRITATPFAGANTEIMRIRYEPLIASNHSENITLNTPLRLEPSSNVVLINSSATASIDATAIIFFYEEEP